MMIRITKNIPVFFLFLAVFVFYAHLIIPHDHHIADSDVFREQPCPASNKDASRHPAFPVHCHAFNDLTSEKAVICVIIKSIKFLDFESRLISNSNRIHYQLFTTIISDSFIHPINYGSINLSSLRAPPECI
jgi:hypothetical protein